MNVFNPAKLHPYKYRKHSIEAAEVIENKIDNDGDYVERVERMINK